MDFVGNPIKLISDVSLVRLDGLATKEEQVLGKEALEIDTGRRNSVIGLYFSSNLCPNCNSFTAQLKTSYERIKRNYENFEIIYVSLENYEENVCSVENQMPPCLALPATDNKTRAKLCKWLCVRTIPSLILVDVASGRVVNRNARQRLLEDPDAINFPWPDRSLNSIFTETGLVDSSGAPVSLDLIQGRIKGLYFSANWCPPCKGFTPHLAHTYTQIKNGKDGQFQIIFVSSDRSEESFRQYFGTMPWLAVPYDQEKRRKELANIFEVHGIPTFILLDEEDRIITREGRHEVLEDAEGNKFPWKPNLVEELTDRYSTQLNDAPLLVLFTDNTEMEQSKELLLPVAKELKKKSPDKMNVILFFVGGESELCDTIRDVAHLEDEVPLLCILDMLREEKYVFEEDLEMSTAIIRQFTMQFLNGDLCPKPFCT